MAAQRPGLTRSFARGVAMISAAALAAGAGAGVAVAAPEGDRDPWGEPVVDAPWLEEELGEGAPVEPRVVAPSGNEPELVAPGDEVVGQRTATSKTFATDEGGVFETRLFAEAVHVREQAVTGEVADVKDGPGEWVEVDTDLVTGADGRLVGAAVEGLDRHRGR